MYQFKLSIIVPVYNEADNLINLYRRCYDILKQYQYEIVFINDGSKDNSLEVLMQLAKNDENIKILDFSRNFGKEIALTAGLDFVTGDAIIPIDADLQDPPELIPEMIAKWQEGYDVVYARRRERNGETWLKKWTAKKFYSLMSKLTDINMPRDTGDFRLMDKAVVDALKKIKERHRFMKGLFSWIGFKQIGIEYDRDPRYVGKSKWNYWKLWNFALEGIISFSKTPLQIAMYFGFFVASMSFIYAIIIIVRTIIYGRDLPGYASLITIILFLGGIQLFTIGILGEYIGRIHDEVKHRPLYILKDVYGFTRKDKNIIDKYFY